MWPVNRRSRPWTFVMPRWNADAEMRECTGSTSQRPGAGSSSAPVRVSTTRPRSPWPGPPTGRAAGVWPTAEVMTVHGPAGRPSRTKRPSSHRGAADLLTGGVDHGDHGEGHRPAVAGDGRTADPLDLPPRRRHRRPPSASKPRSVAPGCSPGPEGPDECRRCARSCRRRPGSRRCRSHRRRTRGTSPDRRRAHPGRDRRRDRAPAGSASGSPRTAARRRPRSRWPRGRTRSR